MNTLRNGVLSLLIVVLLSCGGGGGGGGGAPILGAASTAGTAANTPDASASPTIATGTPSTDVPSGAGTGSQGLGSASGPDGSIAASASGGDRASYTGGSPGSSTGGSAGSPSATSPGPATGSQGLGGIASNTEGSTASAVAGDEGSGVGSGGTGISTADATGVGAVDGAGSIIVNGLRYATDSTIANIEDAAGLQLGMSVKVTGPVNSDFTNGVARRVDSAADLRGPLSSVDLKQGSLVVLGTTVTTDDATVWADASGLAALLPGHTLQIWGLPGAPGVIRATRVEQRDASTLVLTGTVQQLDPASRTFRLGGVVVDYHGATPSGSLDGRPLADGTLVRVRASAVDTGKLTATGVQWWYPVPITDGVTAQLSGDVTRYGGLSSFQMLGVPVDASTAKVTGGPAASIGNGVRLDIGGVMSGGVLRATKLKIRHVPGTGGPASFDLIGTVGAFKSPSDFRVRGQPVNASGPDVAFTNGTAANLRNGVKVEIRGANVVDGVLTATEVVFQ